MQAPTKSQMKINALRRLVQEHSLYLKEAVELQKEIDCFESSSADEYEIKKLKEILEETNKVISRVRKMLEQELNAVKAIFKEDPAESEEAKKAVEAAQEHLDSTS